MAFLIKKFREIAPGLIGELSRAAFVVEKAPHTKTQKAQNGEKKRRKKNSRLRYDRYISATFSSRNLLVDYYYL